MGGRRAVAASALALALALPAAIACEQALSIDGPVTVAPHEACGISLSPGECQACVSAKCCSQASTCASDPECASYESCTLGCGADYACRTRCAVSSAQSQKGIAAFDQCIASACSDACQETCGLPAVPTAPDAAAACAACMGMHTCQQAQQCTHDIACEELSHCLAGCFTLDCHQACLAAYDGGAFTTLEVQLVGSCLKPCELGELWICLGAEPNSTLPPGDHDVTLTLADSTSGKPLGGVDVDACGPSDVACDHPTAMGKTDTNGSATLTFPPQTSLGLGFRGYFEFLPPPGDASVDVPELLFPAQNFSVAHAHLNWVAFTPASLADDAAVGGVQLDMASHGQLLLQAYDCLQAPASGVVFQVSGTGADGGSAPVLYWSGGGFVSSSLASSTGLVGLGAVFNVPPGTVDIVATPLNVGRPSSKVTAFVRAGWITSVALAPTE